MRFEPRLRLVDCYTPGDVEEVSASGVADPPAVFGLEKLNHLRQHRDLLHTALLLDPRV